MTRRTAQAQAKGSAPHEEVDVEALLRAADAAYAAAE
jgi:hypothetical protein